MCMSFWDGCEWLLQKLKQTILNMTSVTNLIELSVISYSLVLHISKYNNFNLEMIISPPFLHEF